MLQNSKVQNESRTFIKERVNNFIMDYEQHQLEEQLNKQKIKLQVRQQLLAMREKSRLRSTKEKNQTDRDAADSYSRSSTFKTMLQDKPASSVCPPEEQAESVNKGVTFKAHRLSQMIPELEFGEDFNENMTFNKKKRNRSLKEEINVNRFDSSELEHKEQIEEENRGEEMTEQEIKRQIKANLSRLRQVDSNREEEKRLEEENKTIHSANKSASANKSVIRIKQQAINWDKVNSQNDVNAIANKDSELKTQKKANWQQMSHEEDQKPEHIYERKNPAEEAQGLFLTMEQQESMETPKVARNCAFEVKMGKTNTKENVQELQRLKIQELERKRMDRLQEFRRNESQKKSDPPRVRNASAHRYKAPKEDEQETPLTNNIEKKQYRERSEKQIPRQETMLNHESHYGMKTNHKINVPLDTEKETGLERDLRPVSPYRTPKIAGTDKAKGSSRNVFNGESPAARDKSSTRQQEPRIEPKDRKNSFTKQSNKKLMINAITYVCFPGQLNRREREKLIDVLESSQHEFFIFLFKEYSRKIIKGIYTLDAGQSRLEKIYGEKAPFEIISERVQEFYRFDSGSREFKKVDGCKSFSLAVHAVDLK